MILFEDNATCITPIRGSYIEDDKTKHIGPKFILFTSSKRANILIVKQIQSCDNVANIFTKPLSIVTFKKIVHGIGMRILKDLLS